MNCPACGAALAEDQRYCLNCGRRHGEARVDFRRHLDTKAAASQRADAAQSARPDGAPAEPSRAERAAEKPQRDYAPLAAAGGIAVLGVMLLIGVLIGRGTGSPNDSAATPQVITVGAAESSSGETGEGQQQQQQQGDGDGAASKGSGSKGGKNENAVAGGSADTGDAPVASDEQLEALQEKTGEDYAKESAKLPDEIATPGEPPPTDNKAPGGGSGGTTIE